VLLTIIKIIGRTIEAGVIVAVEEQHPLNPNGPNQVIRKKIHVKNAGIAAGILNSLMFFMWTAISTTAGQLI
jgi:hypothetical protein